jgi:hypothetical protein
MSQPSLSPDLLPTVVLENARTGQPQVVNLADYMAQKDTRYANWRLLAHGDFIAPPPLAIDALPELYDPAQRKTPSSQSGIERILARPQHMPAEQTRRRPRRKSRGKYGR